MTNGMLFLEEIAEDTIQITEDLIFFFWDKEAGDDCKIETIKKEVKHKPSADRTKYH